MPEPMNGNGNCDVHQFDDDDVVIAGMAGVFPESDSVKELGDQIMQKTDLITSDDRRWTGEHPDIPKRGGRIKDVTRFDSTFFEIPPYEVRGMDPIARILLEKTFETIYDAGMHPKEFEGTRTGVFIGSCILESEVEHNYDNLMSSGMSIKGCNRGLLGSRISNYLKMTGPAYSVDTACSSSMYSLDEAFRAIRSGLCDAAFVGAGCICLQPKISLSFFKLGVLSPDGKCKCFSKDANGYVRSEAVAVLLLQKAKNARRIYSHLVHTKTNCDGYKEYGITFPSAIQQKAVMREVYEASGVNPKFVEYVEAHATGTAVGDPIELETIEEVLCNDRNEPLLVGSIKCNIGHTEPASGLCSIAKVVYAYNTGYIPPNIHTNNLRDDVRAITDGTLKVVQEITPWKRGYSAVSSFGFGGANAHVLLRNVAKIRDTPMKLTTALPYLVCVSGRTKTSISKLLDDVASRPLNVEHIALMHEAQKYAIDNHTYRGFSVLENRNGMTITLSSKSGKCNIIKSDAPRPIWMIFKGIGIQWNGIGASMMEVPAFSNAIMRCHDTLQSHGLDVHSIVVKPNQKTYTNLLDYIVGVVAIQIALYDALNATDIKPDKFIGHGIGEIVCSYAAGCLTLKEAILTAYFIAKALKDTRSVRTSMADIRLSADQTQSFLSKDVSIVYYNGPKWCTVAGCRSDVEEFVAQMSSVGGVGAKLYKDLDVAMHTAHIADFEADLLRELHQVIKRPKKRGSRWISSSVLVHETKIGEIASPEYFVDMILNPVLFQQAMSKMDYNSIVISLLTNGMMSACIQSMQKQYTSYITMTNENRPNTAHDFLTNLGRLFVEGANPNLVNLYPKVEYPVAVNTPMLSHLIEWDHHVKWFVPTYTTQKLVKRGTADFHVDLDDSLFEYISGHVIDHRILFPATGYLSLAWQVFAGSHSCMYISMPVVFEDVKFLRATNLMKGSMVFLTITLSKGGTFEILENKVLVVTGKIRRLTEDDRRRSINEPIDNKELQLSKKDFYKELRLRGYKYSGQFQSIVGCNLSGTKAKIAFRDNWVTYLDALMQIRIIQRDTRGLFVPTRVEKVVMDTEYHYSQYPTTNTRQHHVDAHYDPYMDSIRAGGVEIKGLDATAISRRSANGVPVVEKNVFVPYISTDVMKLEDIIRTKIQLVLESVATYKIRVLEVNDEEAQKLKKVPISPLIRDSVEDLPLMQPELLVITREKIDLGPGIEVKVKNISDETNILVYVGTNLLGRPQVLERAFRTHGSKPGFVIARELVKPNPDNHSDLEIMSSMFDGTEYFVLLRKLTPTQQPSYVRIQTDDYEFPWIEQLKNMMTTSKRVVLWAEHDIYSGLLGLFNCLKQEQSDCMLNAFLIMDQNMPAFDPQNPFYKKQIDKMLPVNIFKNGVWGSYRHLKMKEVTDRETETAFVNVLCRGDLSSLTWIETRLANPESNETQKRIHQIYYAALNFRDIMTATGRLAVETIVKGRLEQECVQGLEFAGKTDSGDRVMGLTSNGALANMVIAEDDICWKVPDEWSLEEAATVPVVYSTVLYAFKRAGGLKRRSSVLIHAGSGGIGQAAIHYCLAHDCNVFTTVGTEEKREFIRKTFPTIPESHIGNSRDISFEAMIQRETNRRGVDYVLNSLAEEKLQASLRCVAPLGCFLEIGKFDMANNNLIGFNYFDNQRSFVSVMLDRLIDSTPAEKRDLRDMLYKAMAKGIVKPLSRTIFEKEEVQAAFRYMAHGKHIGKVLVKVRGEEEIRNYPPKPKAITALPRYMCSSDGVYVICGGLGGFGLELADRLALRGARRLLLTSRRGLSNGYQLSRIRTWEAYGVRVEISTDDITTAEGCKQLLQQATSLGPVHAIFNLAVVLDDCLFENQSAKSFQTSFRPKAFATKHLDTYSRMMCPELRDFVVFSSVSCGRGNAGQTNYGAANSVMERICEARARDGLPAIAIQWGAVGDVGLVADRQIEHQELEIGGTLQQSIVNCLDTLDQIMGSGETIVSSMVVAEKKVSVGGGNLLDTIGSILGVKDIKSISASTPLSELGLDSMTGVEIKQTLERDFEIFLSPQEIRSLTFGKLLELSEKDNLDVTDDSGDNSIELEMLLRNVSIVPSTSEPVVTPETAINDDQLESVPLAFMLPGVDGCCSSMMALCKKLKFQVKILQLGYVQDETIKSNAENLAKLVKEILKPGEEFTLIAYSYGVIIALEVAKILEEKGHKGRLICIDGSPRFLKNLLYVNMGTEETFQDALINLFSSFIVVREPEKLNEELANAHTWSDKLDTLIKHSSIQMDVPFYREVCSIIYHRMILTNELNVENVVRINSRIQLVRPMTQPKPEISADYELMLYTKQKVDVHMVEDSNHVTILDKQQTAEIINDIMFGKKQSINI